MGIPQTLSLGYRQSGGRASLSVGGPGNKVLALGARADEISRLLTVSAEETGIGPVVFDLGGRLSRTLSRELRTFDYRSFLYDAFRLASPESWHSQMVAAAYAVTLDLTSEEESIINSALQKVASEGNMASPSSLYGYIGAAEGFRGYYVDKLKGRVGGLRNFDATEDRTISELFEGNIVVDFHSAPYPQAAELEASLFLAK